MGISRHEVTSPLADVILRSVEGRSNGEESEEEVLKAFLRAFYEENPYTAQQWRRALGDLVAYMPRIRVFF